MLEYVVADMSNRLESASAVGPDRPRFQRGPAFVDFHKQVEECKVRCKVFYFVAFLEKRYRVLLRDPWYVSIRRLIASLMAPDCNMA